MSHSDMGATSRLTKDYLQLKRDPVPYVTAEPVPSNILEWHYVVRGVENSLYEDGYYHGKMVFTQEFPFQPPAIYMITPNGRFETNTPLCLSISDYHPESWNPAWSVSTILTGLLSFMLDTTPTLGSIESSDHQKRCLALKSLGMNVKNKMFCQLFPEFLEDVEARLEERREALKRECAAEGVEEVPLSRPLHPPFLLHRILFNVLVLFGFVFLACMAQYVLLTISDD